MRADKVNEKHRNLRISTLVSLLARPGRLHGTIEVYTNDEFDQLINAFNTSCTLACAEQKAQESFSALRQAKDELDIRVRQRTSDLAKSITSSARR